MSRKKNKHQNKSRIKKKHLKKFNTNKDADTSLFDGPSSSTGLTPLTCTVGAVGVASSAKKIDLGETKDSAETSPHTPTSTTSTALLVSLPNSPDTVGGSPTTNNNYNHNTTTDTTDSSTNTTTTITTTNTMPAKAAPVIITTTTTAEIIDENRFELLGKDITNEIDIYDLPSPPRDDLNTRDNLIFYTSTSTTTTTTSTATTPSTSPRSNEKSSNSEDAETLAKKKSVQKNLNNNHHQSDINSIESISDNTNVPNGNMDWMDELVLQHNSKEILQKSKRKKKNKLSSTKDLDQLDGVPSKTNNIEEDATEDDEKVVKCLYYTLMCCECTIS